VTATPNNIMTPAYNGQATGFSSSGIQVGMMDGSVRNVTSAANNDFIQCSDPGSLVPLSAAW